jgi:hypothetical protein
MHAFRQRISTEKTRGCLYVYKQRSKIYRLGIFKHFNLAHLNYLQSMKSPMFDYITNEESNDLGNQSSFSEDDEDMLMVKSLDYKLRARKTSASMPVT